MKTVGSTMKKRCMGFTCKVLSFVIILCLLMSMASYASVISFNDNDFGTLLNKVYTATVSPEGYVSFSIAGNNGNNNMYNSAYMTEIIQNSMLYISFDYQITEPGKPELRVELRGYGGNEKTKNATNPYWSGWQYDASAPVTANEIHHFEAVLNAKQLMIDAKATSIANSYLFVGNVGSTLTLSNIKIREWTHSGRTLTVRPNDIEAVTGDRPEGYTGNVWHLNESGVTKKTSRIIQDSICTFNSGEEYTIEFWYKNIGGSASYFALVNKNSNEEYAKVKDLVTTGEWTKAQFTFTPVSDMNGTFANITKKDVNGDVCFTDFVVLPKIPVSDTIAITENEIMVVNDAEINIEGYFDAPEKLELKKDDKVIEAAKSNVSSDFSGYTKATYKIILNEPFSDEGIYNISLNDLWKRQRTVAVKLVRYSDELKQLSLQKAGWTEICFQENLSVAGSGHNRIEGKFDLKEYLASDCAVFKVEFDIKIDTPVSDDSVTEIMLRTGSDPGHTIYRIDNSELTSTDRHYSYIDNQSLSDRYNLSNGQINDRYKNSQWWFFVRNKCASQNVTLSNIRIYALTKNADGNILLGTAKLMNKNASQSKALNGALAIAKYDSDNRLTEFKAESFELTDETVSSGGTQIVLKNGVQSGETGYANIIIDLGSDAGAANYKCFWFDSLTNIRPLAAACDYSR